MIMIYDTTLSISTPKAVPAWKTADNYAALLDVKSNPKKRLFSFRKNA